MRCLEPIDDEVEVTFQELFVYDDQQPARPTTTEDDEVSRLEGDLLDLEPLLRDAVVLALPFQPLCEDDCPGCAPSAAPGWRTIPDHAHDEAIDPRWAGLAALQDPAQSRSRTQTDPGRVPGRDEQAGTPAAV